MSASLEDLHARYESTGEKIQDSITESYMGEEREFMFNMDREIYGLKSADIDSKDNAAERYINVLNEYKKMITCEKSQRRIKDQIGKVTMAKTMKENLKEPIV